jgi:ABC-type multidrug transport system fused ATPase/permease subunit
MTAYQKIVYILTPAHRRAAVGLLGLMLIGMALETLGIGLIIPVLAVIVQDDLATRYPTLAPWLSRLGNPSQEWLVVASMLTLAGVTALRVSFVALLTLWQSRFAHRVKANLSQRLFAGYLRQPYEFHLQRNSAQLIRNAMGQVQEVCGLLTQGLQLTTEILVLIGISALLAAVEPLGALLVTSTLGLAGWGASRFTRRFTQRWGREVQYHEGLRLQHLQQGLGGAKDVKLLGRENDFLGQYHIHNVGSARAQQLHAAVQAFPRLWLELIAVTGLAGVVILMILRGSPVAAVLPTLGLFAAAAFRLMPSLHRVLHAMQGIRYSSPALDTVLDDLRLSDATRAPQRGPLLPFKQGLTLEQISFRYPLAQDQVLSGISLSIPRGAAVGFIGGSGSGKSTLADIILGLFSPDSGAVRVDGIDIQTNLRGWQDQLGYVPQSIFLTDDTLRRNVAFGLPNEEIDEAAVCRAILAAQLDEFVSDLPQGLDTMVGERGIRLSGGQRQRIGIARALYHDPPVLVLDEATSSLDTVTELGVMDAVRALQGRKTLIIVAHRLSTVEHCDRLFRLEHGRLVEESETLVALRANSNSPDSSVADRT